MRSRNGQTHERKKNNENVHHYEGFVLVEN